jgi:hypothetical protein
MPGTCAPLQMDARSACHVPHRRTQYKLVSAGVAVHPALPSFDLDQAAAQ